MNYLDQFHTLSVKLFKLLGYDVISSSAEIHAELDISIVHITLEKKLASHIINELALSSQVIVRAMTAQACKIDEESVQVSIDLNGELMQLITDLRTRARIYSDRAMTFGVPVRMDPLPAFHRRIIHTFLQKTPGIHTESFGVGRDRHIVISVLD